MERRDLDALFDASHRSIVSLFISFNSTRASVTLECRELELILYRRMNKVGIVSVAYYLRRLGSRRPGSTVNVVTPRRRRARLRLNAYRREFKVATRYRFIYR